MNKTDGQEDASIGTRISDAVSDDEGNADLVDTQYLLFNLEKLVLQIGGREVDGLGELEASTVEGVDEIRDVPIPSEVRGKVKIKALTHRGVPTNEVDLEIRGREITSLSPPTAAPGAKVVVRAAGLGGAEGVRVTVAGRETETSATEEGTQTRIELTVPAATPTGNHSVVVYAQDGTATAAMPLEVAHGVRIESVSPSQAKPGELLHVYGLGFVANPGPHEPSVEWNGRRLEPEPEPRDTYLAVRLEPEVVGSAAGQGQLVVINKRAQRSDAFPVNLIS